MLEEIVKEVHPNRITFIGGLMTAIGVPLLTSPETDIYGTLFIGAGQGMDYLDGYLAKRFNLRTKEGAKLDPLSDKVKNLFITGYIFAKELYQNNVFLPMTILANYAVDFVSQRQRGPWLDQLYEAVKAIMDPFSCESDTDVHSKTRANMYGKLKTGLQNVAAFGYILEQLYQNHIGEISKENENRYGVFFASLLATSAVLGSIGVFKRLRVKPDKSPINAV